jgi:hypothetical protein
MRLFDFDYPSLEEERCDSRTLLLLPILGASGVWAFFRVFVALSDATIRLSRGNEGPGLRSQCSTMMFRSASNHRETHDGISRVFYVLIRDFEPA